MLLRYSAPARTFALGIFSDMQVSDVSSLMAGRPMLAIPVLLGLAS